MDSPYGLAHQLLADLESLSFNDLGYWEDGGFTSTLNQPFVSNVRRLKDSFTEELWNAMGRMIDDMGRLRSGVTSVPTFPLGGGMGATMAPRVTEVDITAGQLKNLEALDRISERLQQIADGLERASINPPAEPPARTPAAGGAP